MVKNRNWQRRVEVAEARRKESKQRKQRKDSRGSYKSMVHDLLDFLDQHQDSFLKWMTEENNNNHSNNMNNSGNNINSGNGQQPCSIVLHVWTDEIPTDSPPFLDMYGDTIKEQGGKLGFRKMRSMSMDDDNNVNSNNNNNSAVRKGKGRSGSLGEAPNSGKKKVHPRSKEAAATGLLEEEALALPVVRLCRKHFFAGKCSESKGGCRFFHYSPRYKTLATVLHNNNNGGGTLLLKQENNNNDAVKDALAISETAYSSSTISDEPDMETGAMEMVYYFAMDVMMMQLNNSTNDSNDNNDDETPKVSLSEMIANELARKSCSIGSIVYVAVNDILVFDRYLDGVLAANVRGVMIDRHRSRGESIGEESESDDTDIFTMLPGPILEDILVFLPDAAVALASMVCRSWWNEIGRTSPNLWRHLLQRRSWPCPVITNDANLVDSGISVRNEFIHHYTAARDLKSLQAGMASTCFSKPLTENEVVACQSFSARRGAPQFPNGCIAVEVWSAGAMLAAYAQDCSLRLFKAVSRSGTNGADDNLMFCRELACYRVDPYQNTKRRTCRLVGMGLDDDLIGCLCHVVDEKARKESFLLCVLSRDDFLLSDPSAVTEGGGGGTDLEKQALLVIDIGSAVVNYLVSCDEIDDRLLRLIDFLSDGGSVEEVEVLVSQSLAACGSGRFLVEVAVSIPNEEQDGDDSDMAMVLIERKLVLFSSSAGAIIWAGDSTSTGESLSPRHEDMTLSCIRMPHPGGSRRQVCHFSVVSSTTLPVLAGEIEATGNVISPHLVGAICSMINEDETEGDGWQLRRMHHRPIVMTQSDVIVVDTFVREVNDESTDVRSVISFVPTVAVINGGTDTSRMDLENCEVFRLCCLSSEHIVALCRVQRRRRRRSVVEEPAQRVVGARDDDDEDEDDSVDQVHISLDAIIIHVKSRQQLERVCLLDDLSPEMNPSPLFDVPIFLASDGNTVGVGLGWKGVLLTGSDVRSTHGRERLSCEDRTNSKKKKKKQRLVSKGSKKDGFARGMTLRG